MENPRVGLALGSGGARGLAHIGVIKVLEEEKIPIHCIAGSSIGSLIGAFYASGMSPEMMKKLALHLKKKHWLDLTVPKMGFVAGIKIKEMVRILTKGKGIEELSLPLSIVATDLVNGERVVFTRGPIAEAVRASISIPGIFVPEEIDGRLLIDGGVIDRVPIQALKEMGVDVIIGVDVGISNEPAKIGSIFDVIAQTIDIMEREMFRMGLNSADVLIQPNVGQHSSISFTQIEELILAGEQAARENLTSITEAIQAGGIHETT
jgi:NTE family protein